MMMRRKMFVSLVLILLSERGGGEGPGTVAECPPAKPRPDEENVKYGPHERNVLDLWMAKSDKPAPLVLFIHGGGFRQWRQRGSL